MLGAGAGSILARQALKSTATTPAFHFLPQTGQEARFPCSLAFLATSRVSWRTGPAKSRVPLSWTE